jgi:hypothetical protein
MAHSLNLSLHCNPRFLRPTEGQSLNDAPPQYPTKALRERSKTRMKKSRFMEEKIIEIVEQLEAKG